MDKLEVRTRCLELSIEMVRWELIDQIDIEKCANRFYKFLMSDEEESSLIGHLHEPTGVDTRY